MGIQIYAANEPYSGRIDLWVRLRRDDGNRLVATKVIYEDVEPASAVIQEPLMSLEPEDAIYLMDSLWRAGIRPSESSNPSETVSAHKEHIASLKSVTDRLFGIIE